MKLPTEYRDIIFGDLEPGEAYRRCLTQISEKGTTTDYNLTEIIAYGTEIRYAIDILRNGRPERFWNFGDLRGDADARLFSILDKLPDLRIAFVGSGPYPVTALLIRERYPQAEIACIDNNIAAYLLSKAIFEKLQLNISCVFNEAMEIDYSVFNVVIVAAMVSGKSELAEMIINTSDAFVILRGTVTFDHPRLIQFGATFRDDGAIMGAKA